VNIRKEAQRDAHEYALAKMYYGEGAGTRRKLINASIDYKIRRYQGYAELFENALADQNMADLADVARRERHRKDVSMKVDRNVRGLINGNKQSLTTGAAVISALVYFARQTGYDKKIEAHVKMEYYKAKRWVKVKKADIKSRKIRRL